MLSMVILIKERRTKCGIKEPAENWRHMASILLTRLPVNGVSQNIRFSRSVQFSY